MARRGVFADITGIIQVGQRWRTADGSVATVLGIGPTGPTVSLEKSPVRVRDGDHRQMDWIPCEVYRVPWDAIITVWELID